MKMVRPVNGYGETEKGKTRPQMTQMNADKSRSCIDRELSTFHSSARLNHRAGSEAQSPRRE